VGDVIHIRIDQEGDRRGLRKRAAGVRPSLYCFGTAPAGQRKAGAPGLRIASAHFLLRPAALARR